MTDAGPSQHFGRFALAFVRRMLEIDDASVLEHEDGFSWWAGDVAIRFRWRAPVVGEGLPLWRLTVELDAAERVEIESASDRAALTLLCTMLNQCSIVVEDGVLRLRALVYATPEGDSSALAQLVYRAAFMARVATQVLPPSLKLLGGRRFMGFGGPRLVRAARRMAGRRRQATSQLDAFMDAAAVDGAEASPLDRRPDLGAAMLALREAGCDKVAGPPEDEGLDDVQSFNVVIETEQVTSLLELRLDERNPSVGNGLLMVLRVRFPEGHAHGDSFSLAQELSAAEWRASKPLMVQGSWTANAVGADVAYSVFYPNMLHHPALGRTVALDGLRRVRWVFDHYGYEERFSRAGPYVMRLLSEANRSRMEA